MAAERQRMEDARVELAKRATAAVGHPDLDQEEEEEEAQ